VKPLCEMDAKDVLGQMVEMSAGEAFKIVKMVLIAYFMFVWGVEANPDKYKGWWKPTFDNMLKICIIIEADIEREERELSPADIHLLFETEVRKHFHEDISPVNDDDDE